MPFNLFPKAQKSFIGMDITQQGIIISVLATKNKILTLQHYDYQEFEENTIQNNLIVNKTSFINTVNKIIEKNKITTKLVNIAFPSTNTLIKTIKLPPVPLEELPFIVPQEASKHIPAPLQEMNIDFSVLDLPTKSNENKIDVLLVAIQKSIVKNYTDVFDEIGLTVANADITPFAAIRTLASAKLIDDTDKITLSILIGNENTDVNFVYKGKPVFSNNFPIGKKNIVEALENNGFLNKNDINKLLPEITLGTQSSEDINSQKSRATNIIKGVYNNICNEISKTIEFYNSETAESLPTSNIYLSGCGICVQNIDKYIEGRLKIKSSLCNSLKFIKNHIDYSDNSIYPINIPALAPSIGLALKGL